MRKRDRKTPHNLNALFVDIEMLGKKRLGLVKPPLEYCYNSYRPEYVLEHIYDEDDIELCAEFYAYAMTNNNVVYSSLLVKCMSTVVDTYQIVALDGGRYSTPTPE